MYSAEPTPSPRVDPLIALQQLAGWLAGAIVHLALGLVLGVVLARILRRRQLHWSWAAPDLALAWLARGLLAVPGWSLFVGAILALALGRRWHREDLATGTDLAASARRRSGPLGTALTLARRIADRIGWPGGARARTAGQVALGRDASGRVVRVPLGGAGGGTHALVVGATGAGKTVTQMHLAVSAVERGMAAIVIDPKRDPGMRARLAEAASSAGRSWIEWTPLGPSVYNPYGQGGETEIADKALAGERFTEPHYLRQAQRYLGHEIRVLRAAGTEVCLRRIVQYLDPEQLELLARSLPEEAAQPTYAYLDSLTARQRTDLAGARDRLAILAESDVGPWLDPDTPGAQRFDLLEAVRMRAVVYFGLESDSRPLLAQMLGAAIVGDLQTVVAALQGRPVPAVAVIDEFAAVAAQEVVRLFGRARSAGVSIVLGTQELADLRLPARVRLLEQVMGNLSVLIAHRQVVPDSATLISSLAGSAGGWRTAHHSDGRFTRTRTREALLEDDEIKGLPCGWAAVIVLAGNRAARIAHIFAP